ncbi:MAG: MFS transporter, partial [Steroidobacterales bacterium]
MTALRIRTPIFAMLFGFAFTGYIQRSGISVAAERIMPELGLSQIQIGWVMTAFLFTYTVFQIPASLLGQVVGARRMLTAIGLTTVLASMLTAAAPLIAATSVIFLTLLFARGMLGAAQSALFPVTSGTVRHWYPVDSWSSMQGLTVTALWFGAAAASPLVAGLMQSYGWQRALVYSSVPSLLLVALWWGFARDRPDLHPRVSREELAELAGNPSFDAAAPLTWKRVLGVLSDPQILLITLSYTIMNYVFYLVMFWSFLYLVQDRKLSVLESGWLAALPFVVAGIAAAAGGRLADALRARFGDRIGMRIIPLVALPLAAVFLYLTVSLESAYWAVAALCLGFACVELNEGPFWAAAMRLQPS